MRERAVLRKQKRIAERVEENRENDIVKRKNEEAKKLIDEFTKK